jgi:hypothetical protein
MRSRIERSLLAGNLSLIVEDALMGGAPVANDSRRITADNRVGLDIAGYDRASADDRSLADSSTLKDNHPLANPRPILYDRQVDRRGAVKANWLAKVVAPSILLQKDRVWANYYAVTQSRPIDATTGSDARAICHIDMSTVGEERTWPNMNAVTCFSQELSREKAADRGRDRAPGKAEVRQILSKCVVEKKSESTSHRAK